MDALVTDQYLDALLAGAEWSTERRGGAADGRPGPAEFDARLGRAVAVVRTSLVRVHPSFRFEEHLAGRLAELAAAGASRAVAAGAARSADVIPFPGTTAVSSDDPLLSAVLAGDLDPTDAKAVARAAGGRSPARPLIVGGALTSAAISLVGVAWMAWRAARPGGSTMSRTVREARARRLADVAELAPGVHGGPA